MTPLMRVMGVLQGQRVDRRPWTAVLSLYGARLTCVPVPDLYRDPAAFAAGARAVRETFAPDILFGPFALPLYAAAWGVGLQYHEHGPPTVRGPSVANVQELLARPDPQPGTATARFLREALAQVAGDNPSVPVVAVLPLPIDLLGLNLGLPGLLNALIRHPAEAVTALERMAGHCLALAAEAQEAGATVGAFASSLLAQATLPPALLRLVLPPCVRVWQASPLPVILHHGGFRLDDNAALLDALPATVVGAVGDPRDDIARLRRGLGSDRLLFHGPAAIALPGLGAVGVLAAAKGLLHRHGHDRRLILATTGPDVPLETEPAAVLALRLAVTEEAGHA